MWILRGHTRTAMQEAGSCILNFLVRHVLIRMSILAGVVVSPSCHSKKYTFSTTNFAYLYQPSELLIRPNFVLHHISDDSSIIYFRLHKEDFLYVRNPNTQKFESNILIRYAAVPDYEQPRLIIDSGTVEIREIRTDLPGYIVGSIPLRVQSKSGELSKFLVAITVRDVNRNLEYPYFIAADRKSTYTGQHYLATDSKGNVYFEPTVMIFDSLCFCHTVSLRHRLAVKHSEKAYPVALPPFSSENEVINSDNFKVIGYTDSLSGCFTFKKSGYYILQTDTSALEGFYVMVSDSDYPLINKRRQLVEPLRYLTTSKEFNDLQASHPDSIKYLADQFWLSRAGSVERARNLVKAYYGRVQRANELFTSFKEGWKTDRGMIFIVFGPPNVVYRYSDREVWIYGDDSSALQYRFTFSISRLPFSGFYHVLERHDNYRFIWGQAVDAWRSGRIYSIKDIKREQDERDQQLRYQRYPYFWF